jgi:hypothetical protein
MASAKPAASGQRKRSSGTGNAQRKGGKTYLGPALVATVDRCERGEAVLVAGTSAPVVFFVPRKSFLETCLEGQQVRLRLVADWPHLHPEIGGRVLRLEIARWESDLVWVWHGTRAFRLPATLWRRPQMRDTRLLLVIDPIELEMPVYPDEPVEVPALTDGLPLVPPREAGKSDQGRGMRGAGGKPEPSSLSTAPAAIPAGS